MKYKTVNQIRDLFLDFFVDKGHTVLPSFPLVPQGDNSLLLINSGMAPMKAFFTGQEAPPSKRVVTCQKCIRTIDIDDVGKDARHGSFFEMLGNFSFGDYFKKEAIPWAWEFLTEKMEIPIEKLLVSVYEEDDEAYDIWLNTIKVPAEKIYRLGKKDNFWEHGVGPCGPCTEIHFDRGEKYGCSDENCKVGCDCDRFMEIWNLVFTQFEKNEDGSFSLLTSTNIDTGMGLERLAIVLQEADSIFEIDNIKSVRDKVLLGVKNKTSEALISANIIADHIRSVVFMASDGVLPSNEGRGYVLRRLLRRAIRHGKSIGLNEFAAEIANVSIEAYCHAYPGLKEKEKHIVQVINTEESRFLETLDTGMNLLQKQIDELQKNNEVKLSGANAFKLYDTFGFPPDLTREILEEKSLKFDEEGFKKEMENQKQRARAARGVSTYMGADETVYHKLPPGLPTEFIGYDFDLSMSSEILAIIADGEIKDEAHSSQQVAIVLSKTPFYAASGGQKGDIGLISVGTLEEETIIEITDCINVAGNNTVHIGEVKKGQIKKGLIVKACINSSNRAKIKTNHSATHILQSMLRSVLGDHVEQAGSDVSAERLRFDFTHTSGMTPSEREEVENRVNDIIWQGIKVEEETLALEEARKRGAMALFGEKYGETVRMVSIAEKSIELCGGTHVKNTKEIGMFRIISESGIASGVRRIEAVTGQTALQLYKEESRILNQISLSLKAKPESLSEKVRALLDENKNLKKEAAKMSATVTSEKQGEIIADLINSAEDIKGFYLIVKKLENYDTHALRTFSDKLKLEVKSGVVLLCGVNNETNTAQFLAFATEDAVKQGIHAGNIVKSAASLCGGGGGGRPNHAQAGGKNINKVDEALKTALNEMKGLLE